MVCLVLNINTLGVQSSFSRGLTRRQSNIRKANDFITNPYRGKYYTRIKGLKRGKEKPGEMGFINDSELKGYI